MNLQQHSQPISNGSRGMAEVNDKGNFDQLHLLPF